MTPDVDKSVDFYTNLFGWGIEETESSLGPYKMLKSADETFGGFIKLDAEAGSPPHWISYVNVDDLDAALQRAESSGGTVCVPATSIEHVGRFGVIQDPTGGSISAIQLDNGPGPEKEGGSPVGQFIWEELLCTDPAKAAAFYGEVFGWSTEEMDMGPMGVYRVQKRGDIGEAGIIQKPADTPGPSSWLSYVHVDDVDAEAARVKELGGNTFVEPTDIPNIGRFSVHADPVGGMFALYKPAG
ncbi:MAG: VOC family protein [Planctomycetota bacterium]|jgi:predicted enzyme related to lactoylglutathione lyase